MSDITVITYSHFHPIPLHFTHTSLCP
uniref:Uncharacterized protein n=1 Tax=Anguilla anguilla TaxID=7936 RepID=A0A0E9TK82_ANGAN